MDALVSTDWLAQRLSEKGVRVADLRWYLEPGRRGRDAYAVGHIPGAVFFDLDTDLSAPGGGRGLPAGRHPWPSAEQVERVIGGAGIGPATHVVAYDDQAGAVAARLWYLLRAHGHEAVSVLDGGLLKWVAEGRPTETAIPAPPPTSFPAKLLAWSLVAKPEMIESHHGRLVLDARLPARYLGEVEPIDPRPGHIPGARNAPFTANLTDGPLPVFRSPAELRGHYEALGAATAEPVVYCGSGVTACHDLLALHLAGLRGRLYPGSWSEWSSDPSLPAELTAAVPSP